MTRRALPIPEQYAEARERARAESAPGKRVFEVAGPQKVADKSTGEKVELDLTNAQAAALIASGAVREVKNTKRSQDQENERA